MTGINKRKHNAELCDKNEKKKKDSTWKEIASTRQTSLRGRYVSVMGTNMGVITPSHRTIRGNILFGCVSAVFVN